jgi:flagellar assembly protein FliH
LSNVYKQRFTTNEREGTRVINSNDKIAEKIHEITQEALKKMRGEEGESDGEGGFVEGLGGFQPIAMPNEEPEISLEEVREEAERLIAEAKEKAVKLIEKASKQSEGIKNQAKQEGFQQGLKEGQAKAVQELSVQEKRLFEKGERLEADYQTKLEELEPRLIDVIANVFEKVFHVQFDDKKEILLYLVQNTILNVEGSKEFQVRVSDQNFQFLETHKGEILERVGSSLNVEFLLDPFVKENQCVIETDSGVFECGLGIQLENLIKAIRSLSL